MPGKAVKNWSQYHALRDEGFSKKSAAKITNSKAGKKARSRGKKAK